MLEIKDIKINGLKSYNAEAYTSFDLGTNVIIGNNGAGKSTLLEAIRCGLFGNFSDTKAYQPYLKKNRDAYLDLVFAYNNEEYRIVREFKWNKKGETVSSQSKLRLPSGEDITGTAPVNHRLSEILGIDDNTLDLAVFINQGGLAEIIKLKPRDFRKKFADLLNLEEYEHLKKKWFRYHRKKLNQKRDIKKDMDDLKTKIKELPKLKKQLKQLENDILAKKKNRKSLGKEFDKIKELKEKKAEFEKTLAEAEKDIKTLKVENAELHEEINQEAMILSDITVEKIDDQLVKELENKYNSLKIEFDAFDKKFTRINGYFNTIETLTKQNNGTRSQIQLIQENFTKYGKIIKEYGINVSQDAAEIIDKLEDVTKTIDTKIEDNETKLSKLTDLDTKKSKLTLLEDNFTHQEDLKNKIETNQLRELSDLFTKSQEEIKALETRLQENDKTLKADQKRISADLDKAKNNERSYKEEINAKTQIIKALEEKGEHTCERCYSKITRDRIEETCNRMYDEISKYKEKKEQFHKQVKQLSEDKSTIDEELTKYHNLALLRGKKSLSKIVRSYQKIRLTIDEKKSEIEQLSEVIEKEKINKDVLVKANLNLKIRIKECDMLKKLNADIILFQENIRKNNDGIKNNNEEKNKLLQDLDLKPNISKVELGELKLLKQEKRDKYSKNYTSSLKISNSKNTVMKNQSEIDKYSKLRDDSKEMLSNSKYKNIDEQYKKKENEIEVIVEEISKLDQEIGTCKKDIIDIENKKEEYNAKKTNYDKLKEKQKQGKDMELILKELYPLLLNNYIKSVEYKTNEILNNIPSESDVFNIRFIPYKKDLNIKIISSVGSERDLMTLSGGEKMSLAFSLRVAISQDIADVGFMVLDEPTDGLDDERKKQLADILKEQRQIRQMLVITHDRSFNSITDNTIHIEQSGGSSRIKQKSLVDILVDLD